MALAIPWKNDDDGQDKRKKIAMLIPFYIIRDKTYSR